MLRSAASYAKLAPIQLRDPCADAQGCLISKALSGQDAHVLAESILAHATVRRKGWIASLLGSPALCRAIPSLKLLGDAINLIQTYRRGL